MACVKSNTFLRTALNHQKHSSQKEHCDYPSVLQLVKSQKMHAKLVIVVETEKEKVLRKEFVFDDRKVKVFLNLMLLILALVMYS